MRKQLIFILSSNFSGSHFCSLLLGSHSRAEHLGELKNLYKKSGGRPCYACGSENDCKLFAGIDTIPKMEIYEELFHRLGDRQPILIDASKKPDWCANFVHDERYEIKLLHLIRDPRALARRWTLRSKELGRERRERIKRCRTHPLRTPQFLFGDMLPVYIYKWIDQNREILRFTRKSNRPVKVVTYKELAGNQDATLADICSWIGVPYEPQQKQYWEFEHHGTQKREYEWVKQQGGATFVDLRWNEFLTEEQQKKITGNKSILRLLEQLHLRFSDDGLEHIPN